MALAGAQDLPFGHPDRPEVLSTTAVATMLADEAGVLPDSAAADDYFFTTSGLLLRKATDGAVGQGLAGIFNWPNGTGSNYDVAGKTTKWKFSYVLAVTGGNGGTLVVSVKAFPLLTLGGAATKAQVATVGAAVASGNIATNPVQNAIHRGETSAATAPNGSDDRFILGVTLSGPLTAGALLSVNLRLVQHYA